RTAALVIAGRDFVPGEQLSAPELPGAVVVVEVLPNGGEILFAANRFYGRPDTASVPAYQLTWADAGGAFPWDSGYTAGESSQPRPGTWRA
ncbi:MAG: DUF4262 domain-containing protein, partial [Actinomycetes bacterium]